MGFADGFYYGQGKLIIETSNLLATDVVRVRSLTDSSKVWNKTVTTVGSYLVFEVPGKDFYRIALMREVDGDLTEITGVNKTVDYGQTIFTNVADKTTLMGLQAILDAHKENNALNIGDEIEVEGQIYQIAAIDIYGAHDLILVSKYLQGSIAFASGGTYMYSNSICTLRTTIEAIYSNWSQDTKKYIKPKTIRQDAISLNYVGYLWTPTGFEVFGNVSGNTYNTDANGNTQFPLFYASENRVKRVEGATGNTAWWLATRSAMTSGYELHAVRADGILTYSNYASVLSFAPAFRMTADV